MRLVIDLQAAQAGNRFRGIGRYSLSLTRALLRHNQNHEVIIVLSGLFPKSIEPIRAELDSLLPQDNIRVWHAPGPVKEIDPDNARRLKRARMLRESFIASLQPDVVHISSFLDQYKKDYVVSIGLLDRWTDVVVTLYDLIPYMNPQVYLDHDPRLKKCYLQRLEMFKKARAWLAISRYSAREGVSALGLDADRVFPVLSGTDFFAPAVDAAREQEVMHRYGITRPFVLSVGGSDPRKNMSRLIQAYARLDPLVRSGHQLVLSGYLPPEKVERLRKTAASAGLKADELLITGYMPDKDLVRLYACCRLFIFPSYLEGFGLPVLEAMACHAPVIGAEASSLPEVIAMPEALFDPFSEKSMAGAINQALQDDAFRDRLQDNSRARARELTWEKTAGLAWQAFERIAARSHSKRAPSSAKTRPRMAFVSPMPPEKSGIADYSQELLPELQRYYQLDVVVLKTADACLHSGGPFTFRSVSWFRENAHVFDRIVYQFGNSLFHRHMLDLLWEHPGVVVLHDFFLSGLFRRMELKDPESRVWSRALYASHGYQALLERFLSRDTRPVMYKYPCNMQVINWARQILVHSEHARDLARQWYGKDLANSWEKVPLVRGGNTHVSQETARSKLGLPRDDFVVCSFGSLDETKENHRLLQAWLNSFLAGNRHCRLVFVGSRPGNDYGQRLDELVQGAPESRSIYFTGRVEHDTYRYYLAAADLAVQLRTCSRGETSAAALDCLQQGLPLIVNAEGSMAELPEETVYRLGAGYTEQELSLALQTLFQDPELRSRLSGQAREYTRAWHSAEHCAGAYADAVERTCVHSPPDRYDLVSALARVCREEPEPELHDLSACVAQNQPGPRPARNFFVDISSTCSHDRVTGIERVTRCVLRELLLDPPGQYRVEPVYMKRRNGSYSFYYARCWTLDFLGCPGQVLQDEPVEMHPGDILITLDLSLETTLKGSKTGLYEHLKDLGVQQFWIVHDILPLTFPEHFPPGADKGFSEWLKTVCTHAHGVLCVSRTVALDLQNWLQENAPDRLPLLRIGWFHHGADFNTAVSPESNAEKDSFSLKFIQNRPTFLMVGTIEPRKGHLQTLQAFDLLWKQGFDINLIIVGGEGWKNVPREKRRNVPQICSALRTHSQLDHRLFWFSDLDDLNLQKIYAASSCLIAASEAEGFGLPLIEAAGHHLPIIARDIPVFREVAAEYAMYFHGQRPEDLARAVKSWLNLYRRGSHPGSREMPRQTWAESSRQICEFIFGNNSLSR